MNRYVIAKHTGTHADVLAAIGAADLLRHLEPEILEFDDRFEIRLPRHLAIADVEAADPGFSYLLRRGRTVRGIAAERIVQLRSAADATSETPDAVVDDRMYVILSRMKAFGGPNRIVSRFARSHPTLWTKEVWECLHGSRNFGAASPLVQLFNPQSAAGYALLKPSSTSRRDKTKNMWAEPFVEWLRFRGYFEGAAGWFTDGDLRLYCPIPKGIAYPQLAAAASSLRGLRLGGSSVKIDCRAVLALTRCLIEGSRAGQRPAQLVRGLCVTHYKDMGQAHTVMATDHLAVPDWFDLRSREQAERWLEILEQHDTVVRRLNDAHSDEFALLKQYRRTFQSRRDEAVCEFITFLADYGALLFRRRAQDYWTLPQLSARGVAAILNVYPGMNRLLSDAGFQAVAAAIRSATVGAQAARYRGRSDHRVIRYGLLADIRRAETLGREGLLGNVRAFVDDFNGETVRRRAAGIRARQIEKGEWEAFRRQIAKLPSSISLGSVLCGFATSFPASESVPTVDTASSLAAIA